MKRIGLVLHQSKPEALTVARWLGEHLRDRGIDVEAPADDATRIGDPSVAPATTFPDSLDLVFVLGGDGTLLRAAEMVYDFGTPLLGINLGRLGFLSELERGELQDGLARMLDSGFDVEERTVIQGEILDEGRTTPIWALNDVIVAKIEIGRAIKLAVSVGGEPFAGWAADGLIVATPTGSTAYSFSAGGPIVSPALDCLVITPVAPHGMFDRSVIVSADEEIAVAVRPGPDTASLSADGGRAVPLSSQAEVRLRAGTKRIRLAKVDPAPFWRLVREKFELPAEPR